MLKLFSKIKNVQFRLKFEQLCSTRHLVRAILDTRHTKKVILIIFEIHLLT